MKTRRENRRFDVGLDKEVILKDAEVRRCPECGEEEIVVGKATEMTRQIAQILAEKQSKLTPREIRFLRTYLGLSSADLAKTMGVAAGSVSRWERTAKPTPMGASAERLLRLMALTQEPQRVYPLNEVAVSAAVPVEIRARRYDGGWRAEASVAG
jgi:putative zinc finger/helix-turn-helix YgiT family protein